MTLALTQQGSRDYVAGTITSADTTSRVTLDRFTTFGYVGIQLSGTWTGTVTFEASVDGTNYVTLNVIPAASGTAVSTSTAVGAWTVLNSGYKSIGVRFSTATSGTLAVAIKSLPNQA